MSLIRSFVDANRSITRGFVALTSRFLGRIDGSEEHFYAVLAQLQPRTVIELGGANRPLYKKTDVETLIGIDIDSSFDPHAHYHEYLQGSIESSIDGLSADLVVSRYLLEHVRDNSAAFRNIVQWTKPGGHSVHLIPLGFHPFSIANRMLSNRAARALIPLLRPGTEAITGYPAFYHLCNSRDIERYMRSLAPRYSIRYFFGAEDYFGFLAPLGCLLHLFNRACSALRLNIFASNAVLVVQIPADGDDRRS